MVMGLFITAQQIAARFILQDLQTTKNTDFLKQYYDFFVWKK